MPGLPYPAFRRVNAEAGRFALRLLFEERLRRCGGAQLKLNPFLIEQVGNDGK